MVWKKEAEEKDHPSLNQTADLNRERSQLQLKRPQNALWKPETEITVKAMTLVSMQSKNNQKYQINPLN